MSCHWSSSDFTMSTMELRERSLLSGVVYLTLIPAFYKSPPAAGSLTLRLPGLHFDLQNIVPSPTICLNYSNPQKKLKIVGLFKGLG